jgi:hypothetical protein
MLSEVIFPNDTTQLHIEMHKLGIAVVNIQVVLSFCCKVVTRRLVALL